jgi:hypothetical protein
VRDLPLRTRERNAALVAAMTIPSPLPGTQRCPATFPRGEAFFVESVKAFREDVPPQGSPRRSALFIAQEINHSREHAAVQTVPLKMPVMTLTRDRLTGLPDWILTKRSRPASSTLPRPWRSSISPR